MPFPAGTKVLLTEGPQRGIVGTVVVVADGGPTNNKPPNVLVHFTNAQPPVRSIHPSVLHVITPTNNNR